MQPKLYVTNYPAGDFRAMPALGGGHALLKWVTSFPGNPAKGLPTVTGLVLLSNAETGAARGAPRRRRGDRAAYGRGRRHRSRDPVPVGRGVDRRHRVRRQRRRDSQDVPRARLGRARCGTSTQAPCRGRRRAARRARRSVARRRARLGHRRHRHARARHPLPGRLAPRGPARLADGRRRSRQGRGRGGGAPAGRPLLRRLGAGEPRRRARGRASRRGSSRATVSPSSAASSPATPRGRRSARGHHPLRLDGLAIQDLAIAEGRCSRRRSALDLPTASR